MRKIKILSAFLIASLFILHGVANAQSERNIQSFEVKNLFYGEIKDFYSYAEENINRAFAADKASFERFVDNVVEEAVTDGIIKSGKYKADLRYEETYRSKTLLSVKRFKFLDIYDNHPHYGARGYVYDTRLGTLLLFGEVFPFDDKARSEIRRQVMEATVEFMQPSYAEILKELFMEETYQLNFYLNKNANPVIIFNPGVTAPYEKGIIEVVLQGFKVE